MLILPQIYHCISMVLILWPQGVGNLYVYCYLNKQNTRISFQITVIFYDKSMQLCEEITLNYVLDSSEVKVRTDTSEPNWSLSLNSSGLYDIIYLSYLKVLSLFGMKLLCKRYHSDDDSYLPMLHHKCEAFLIFEFNKAEQSESIVCYLKLKHHLSLFNCS